MTDADTSPQAGKAPEQSEGADRSAALRLGGALGIVVLISAAALGLAYWLPASYESRALVGVEPQKGTPPELLQLLDSAQARVVVADTVLSASALADLGAALAKEFGGTGSEQAQALRDALFVSSPAARRFEVTAKAASAEGARALARAATRRMVEKIPAVLAQAAGVAAQSKSRVDEALRALSDFVAQHPEAVLDSQGAPRETKARPDPVLVVLKNELKRLERALYDFERESEKSRATENPYDDPSRADTDEVERMKRRAIEIRTAIAAREAANRRTMEQPEAKTGQLETDSADQREQWLERVRALKQAQEESERPLEQRAVLTTKVLEAASLPDNPVTPNRGRILLFGVALGVFAGSLWWGALTRRRRAEQTTPAAAVAQAPRERPPPLPPAATREVSSEAPALSNGAGREQRVRQSTPSAAQAPSQAAPASPRAAALDIKTRAGYAAPHAVPQVDLQALGESEPSGAQAPPRESRSVPSPRDADHLKRVAVVEVNVAGGARQHHRTPSNTAYSYVSTVPPARRIKTLMNWPSEPPAEPDEITDSSSAPISRAPGNVTFPHDPQTPQLVPTPVVPIGRPAAAPESARAPDTIPRAVPPQAIPAPQGPAAPQPLAPPPGRAVATDRPIHGAHPDVEPRPVAEAEFTVSPPSPPRQNGPSPVFPHAVPSFRPDPTLPLDALRPLRNRLYPLAVSGCFVVLVLSTASQAPVKSRVATGLAVLLAQAGHPRVLLVETDFGRPEVHLLCSVVPPAGAGFSQQLLVRQQEGRYDAWRVMRCSETLDVLPEGAFRTLGLAAEQHVPAALRELKTGYDLIVVNGASEISEAEIRALDDVVDGVVVASAPDEPPPPPLRGFSGRQVQMQVVVGSAATAAARSNRG